MAKPTPAAPEFGRCLCGRPASMVVRVLLASRNHVYRYCDVHRGAGACALAVTLEGPRVTKTTQRVRALVRDGRRGPAP